ncbi:hypothetical protein DIX59_10025 [Streptococcus iniae]|uniref:hypothetical protein n=1 Tax=Streptococcus iniae TaxID=1346 RepID=UPI0003688F2E|nr:hypothetical protein [Streptococcus iniae]ESR10549.1 hypothetical protein IUSA1_01345 [Streptococcus iniae IUSA1]KYJ81219.1 hypothetical protein NA30_04270 [Streptococcus iniae]RMI72626.1 hypothetical protein DIX59_10025 [Streptococcus iniae]HEK4517246.1 hypothetical protein [Streptococcus iniae]
MFHKKLIKAKIESLEARNEKRLADLSKGQLELLDKTKAKPIEESVESPLIFEKKKFGIKGILWNLIKGILNIIFFISVHILCCALLVTVFQKMELGNKYQFFDLYFSILKMKEVVYFGILVSILHLLSSDF